MTSKFHNYTLEEIYPSLHSYKEIGYFFFQTQTFISPFCRHCEVTHKITKQFVRFHRSRSNMDRVKRISYLSPMRAAKVQASLRIRAVSPEPSLLAHTSTESRGTFRQKTRSLAPLNGWACAVEIGHDGMLEDTNSLDGAHIKKKVSNFNLLAV